LKINTVPVEAYRQASNQTIKKNQTPEEQAKSSQAAKSGTIILPGLTDAASADVERIEQRPLAVDLTVEREVAYTRRRARGSVLGAEIEMIVPALVCGYRCPYIPLDAQQRVRIGV